MIGRWVSETTVKLTWHLPELFVFSYLIRVFRVYYTPTGDAIIWMQFICARWTMHTFFYMDCLPTSNTVVITRMKKGLAAETRLDPPPPPQELK
jgi:hypothetical protein